MRPEKATVTEDLQKRLNVTPFVFVTDYNGLKVSEFSTLRDRLANVGAQCKVVKNTFLRIAAEQVGLPDFSAHLSGQTAIIIGEKDVAVAAKTLKTFITEFKRPTLRIGVVDKAVVTAEQVNAIAELPSLDVIRAQFLGLLNAPASRLVRTLNEPGASLARLLKAKLDQLEGGDKAAA